MLNLNHWLNTVKPRDPDQKHRAATPLELLFDLVFVVAIAAAGQQLHHAIIENHLAHMLAPYCFVFFALWWAWMNFSWFSSAYDNDDAIFRLLTFVQMIGSLVIAAGIPLVFEQHSFWMLMLGYVIMRCGLVLQWIRAGLYDQQRRRTIQIYVVGIVLVQIGWIVSAILNKDLNWPVICSLIVAELAVPLLAEKQQKTPWHPHHIVERYSLLTIIVLGESITSGFQALQKAEGLGNFSTELIYLMVGGLLLMFTMWWAYFDREVSTVLRKHKSLFFWAYGHYFIFISIASIGAALSAAADAIIGHSELASQYISMIIAFVLIVYTSMLWLLHDVYFLTGFRRWIYPITTIVIACIPFLVTNLGLSVLCMALLYALRLIVSKIIETTDHSKDLKNGL